MGKGGRSSSSDNGSGARYRRFEDFEKKFFPRAHRASKADEPDPSRDLAAGALKTFRKSLPS